MNETERLQLMFKLLDRVPDGIEPMLACLETHIYQVTGAGWWSMVGWWAGWSAGWMDWLSVDRVCRPVSRTWWPVQR